mgnify:CR=1 FL=1
MGGRGLRDLGTFGDLDPNETLADHVSRESYNRLAGFIGQAGVNVLVDSSVTIKPISNL